MLARAESHTIPLSTLLAVGEMVMIWHVSKFVFFLSKV